MNRSARSRAHRARARDGLTRDLELLLLPLAHRGRMDARILGALAPAEAPHWLGAGALGGLTLGSLRYLGDAVPAGLAPAHRSNDPEGRIRHGLVVYDGGQG